MKLDYILNKQIITRIANYTLNYNTIRHVFELFKNIVRFKLNYLCILILPRKSNRFAKINKKDAEM